MYPGSVIRQKYLPVTASIMSQPGTNAPQTKNTAINVRTETDMTLVEFTKVSMKDMGRASVVNSGKTMLPPA